MERRAGNLLAVTFVFTLFLSMSLLSASSSIFGMSTNSMNNERIDAIGKSRVFSASAQKTTTWYHDGSNTTGWTTSYNGWTLNSSGTALYSNITPSEAGVVHAVFSYNLEHDFVVGHDLKMEAQIDYTSIGSDNGGLNLMAYHSSNIIWRLAYSSTYGSKYSWALNYYSPTEYDEDHLSGGSFYTSMWYNDTDTSIRSNLGDGVVSTSEHAGETRVISTIVLDFWIQDLAGATYPDMRVDWIKLTGGALPEIDSPDDVEMEYMDPVDLTWSPDAYTPESFKFYIDDVLEDTGVWDGSALSFPLDGFDPGYYKCELEVYDDMDFTTSDIVWVNVTDTTAPVVSDVADFSIPYGVSGDYLIWTCSEPFPDYFVITKDSVTIDEGAWNGTDLRVSLNGLSVDSYVYKLTVNDTYGNFASDEVIVSVIVDDDSPSVTPLNDISFEFGITGNYLVWICSDLFPESYIILRNGTEIDSGLWNGSNLAVNLDGLGIGAYNFTILLYDTSGNSASDSVIVTVTAPETTPTTPDGNQLIDPMLLIIAGAASVVVLLILVVVFMKKR